MTTKYICAFLNAIGGTLYIGIDDSGKVKGIKLDRNTRDDFTLKIDNMLRCFDPVIMADEVMVSYEPIFTDHKLKKQMKELYVIEIRICQKSCNRDELYFTDAGKCFVRK